jgi:hypothetical protein
MQCRSIELTWVDRSGPLLTWRTGEEQLEEQSQQKAWPRMNTDDADQCDSSGFDLCHPCSSVAKTSFVARTPALRQLTWVDRS